MTDDDLVPVSVRLGQVVPPDDPEDWTRPLTWVAALGMLAGPLVALAWFLVAPPTQSVPALPGTYLVAVALAAGSATTGSTQIGVARAWTATLAAALFAALAVIVFGLVMAGERQLGTASPTLSHAFASAVAGVSGAAAASGVAAVLARRASRSIRALAGAVAGAAVAVVVLLVVA